MEHEAMKELVGDKKAQEIMESWRHYKWIYKMVLNKGVKIKPIIDKYEFKI